jgi:branched-chain amino acid transport system substrate-binding protein
VTPCGAERKGSGRAGHATRWLAVLTAGLALLVGAPSDLQAADAKIAIVVSASGALEPYGRGALEGARLAVEEANAEGNGPSIEIEVFDDASKPGEAKAAAKQAVAGDALVVVGPATTAMGIIVNPVFAEGGIACIGTTAAGDSLTDSATFFRGSFSTGESGGAIASYLRYVLGAPPAIVLLKEDSYGQQVAGGFRHAATRLGLAATYRSFKDVAGAEEAAREAASDPANPAIVLATIDEAAAIIKILRRSVVRGPVLGTNAIAGEFFARHFENEPEEQRRPGYFSDGVYAVTPLLFDSANAETLAFQTRFRSRYDKEPTYISGQGYEAALLAIARSTSTSGATSWLPNQRWAIPGWSGWRATASSPASWSRSTSPAASGPCC